MKELSYLRKTFVRVPLAWSGLLLASFFAFPFSTQSEEPVQGYLHIWGSAWLNSLPTGRGGPLPEELGPALDYASGRYHQTALLADGRVVTWGIAGPDEFRPADGEPKFVSVEASWKAGYAVRDDGSVIDWPLRNEPDYRAPEGGAPIQQIASGSTHFLARRADGTMTAWGGFDDPVLTLPALANVKQIALGRSHGIALLEDGTLRAWGSSEFGQTAIPEDLGGVVAVAAGFAHSVVLTADGRLHVFGKPDAIEGIPTDQPDYVDIAAFGHHTMGLTRTGRVEVWNAPPELTPTIPPDVRVAAIFAGDSHIAVLADKPFPMISQPLEPLTVHPGHTATLTVAATYPEAVSYQWYRDGEILPGATGRRLELVDVSTTDAGTYTVELRDAQGSVNATSTTLSVVSSGESPSQGELRAWGYLLPDSVRGEDDIVTVAAGLYHALLLHADGSVTGIGDNEHGQIEVPADLPPIVDIAAGYHHSLALTETGRVVAWGDNDAGKATPPDGLANVVSIAAGSRHSVAALKDGSVVAWGDRRAGLIDVPASLRDVVQVTAGDLHTLALRRDGTVVAWGRNLAGQTDVPSGLEDVIGIAAGARVSLALTANGRIVAWGETPMTESLHAESLNGVTAISAIEDQIAFVRADGQVGGIPAFPDFSNRADASVLSLAAGVGRVYFVEGAVFESSLRLSLAGVSDTDRSTLRLVITGADGVPLSPADHPNLVIESRSVFHPESAWHRIVPALEPGTDSIRIEIGRSQEFYRARLELVR